MYIYAFFFFLFLSHNDFHCPVFKFTDWFFSARSIISLLIPLVSFSLQFLHFSAPEFLFGFFLRFLCLYQSVCSCIIFWPSPQSSFPFLSIPKAVALKSYLLGLSLVIFRDSFCWLFLLICHTFLFVCPVILLLKTGHKNLMYLNPRIILSHFPRVYFFFFFGGGEEGEEWRSCLCFCIWLIYSASTLWKSLRYKFKIFLGLFLSLNISLGRFGDFLIFF